ncbi:hypothetical protein C2E23DRAFT_539117 [Lenzites betulinus]|nr:hypothetical protein C2E23DRAFT_539117 [Lenzites betulinus]
MPALPPAADAAALLGSGTGTPLSLYRTLVLPAESAAVSRADKACICQARIVGCLLLYPPSPAARRTLSLELASCNQTEHPYQALFDLGAMYLTRLVLIFKKTRGKTPTPSSHPSRPSFDRVMQECLVDLQPAPRDHSAAKAQALIRDNYRCMVTGRVDRPATKDKITRMGPGEDFGLTQCCHIIPDAPGNIAVGGSSPEEHDAASMWAILKQFGYDDVCAELGSATIGGRLHRLDNILTLDAVIHDDFDTMDLWFEAIKGQPNTYKIIIPPGISRPPSLPDSVHFVSHHPDLPLPSPRYLEIHAFCCRILHMSGAAEYVDLIFRDMEELQVLSSNGTSADVLSFALHRRLMVATG